MDDERDDPPRDDDVSFDNCLECGEPLDEQDDGPICDWCIYELDTDERGDNEADYATDLDAEQHADAMAGLAFDQQQRADERDASIIRGD